MECSHCREALSARLDGEDLGVPATAVDRHLATCAACRGWQDALTKATGRMRLSLAEPVPDLTTTVLAQAAVARNRPRPALPALPSLARLSLAAVAILQLAIALPGLLGQADGASVHVAREQGAWELALAVGLLAVASRPWLASGLLPVAVPLGAALILATGLDVASHRTSVLAESSHALPIAGLLLLVLVQRLRPNRASTTPATPVPA